MKKVRVLWLSAISCHGNAHSFFNYEGLEQFLNHFEFIYHPSIDSKYTLEDIVSNDIKCDILLIEGSISKKLEKAGMPLFKIINKYAKIAKKIVTVGTCASFGGIFRQGGDNITGLHFDQEQLLTNFNDIRRKTITVSGCPIHPESLANTMYAIKNDIELVLDEYLRPKDFFAYTIHNGCTRNEYFEYKIDNHKFGEHEGCMYYEHGCQAPFTNGSCNKVLWNGVNSKTRVGHPCMGCTSPDFPKENLYQTKKNMGIPQFLPLGVPKRTYISHAGISKTFKIKRFQEKLFDD